MRPSLSLALTWAFLSSIPPTQTARAAAPPTQAGSGDAATQAEVNDDFEHGLEQAAPAEPTKPVKQEKWTLNEALGLPDWLSISGAQRFMFEIFDEPIRPSQASGGNGFYSRTLIKGTATYESWFATAEFIDSRVISSSSDLPLGTGSVNAVELLQGHIGWRDRSQITEGDELEFRLGRQTLDLAGRRLVSRQIFRNTINNFTGAYSHWENAGGDEIHAFYFLPVLRLPTGQEAAEDNEIRYDDETSNQRFWGIHAEKRAVFGRTDAEVYIYGLDEQDGPNFASQNRDLITVGARFFRAPKPGDWNLDFEAAYQTGTSRPNNAATEDLDHQAEFIHLTAGYQFDADMDPRAEFVFEYASGDADPNDGEWGRFDTLFGARRPDYGPPVTLGPFQRENVITPGVRFHFNPTPEVKVMVQDRFYYLAEASDTWVTTGLQDPTGASGDYLGNQIEARVRWDPNPNYRLEVGAAHVFAGSFAKDVPGNNNSGDTTYGYLLASTYF
jgi:hypothetical protein